MKRILKFIIYSLGIFALILIIFDFFSVELVENKKSEDNEDDYSYYNNEDLI